MQAAERFFEGEFADVMDDETHEVASDAKGSVRSARPRMIVRPAHYWFRFTILIQVR